MRSSQPERETISCTSVRNSGVVYDEPAAQDAIDVQATDALVQAPHNGWAFKWFAGRAEYVAFKDCPQDAAGIVEWNRRLLFLKKWYEDQYVDRFYSADELRDLRRETGITHLLTDRLGPLELEPVYRNETFQVYDLSSLD